MSEGPFEPTDFDNHTPLATKDAAEVSNAHPFVKEARELVETLSKDWQYTSACKSCEGNFPQFEKLTAFLFKYFPEKKESGE